MLSLLAKISRPFPSPLEVLDSDGHMNGDGRHFFPDGDVYNGEFHRGVAQGRGKYTSLRKGWVYEGSFLNNKKHGTGVQTYLSGQTYMGLFHNGMHSGRGVILFPPQGGKFTGIFAQGRLQYWSHGVYEEPEGSVVCRYPKPKNENTNQPKIINMP